MLSSASPAARAMTEATRRERRERSTGKRVIATEHGGGAGATHRGASAARGRREGHGDHRMTLRSSRGRDGKREAGEGHGTSARARYPRRARFSATLMWFPVVRRDPTATAVHLITWRDETFPARCRGARL